VKTLLKAFLVFMASASASPVDLGVRFFTDGQKESFQTIEETGSGRLMWLEVLDKELPSDIADVSNGSILQFTSSEQNEVWQIALIGAIFYGFWRCRNRTELVRTYLFRKIAPPLNAELLFYLFLDPQNCDAIVGDLEERYKLIHKKFGQRRANFWYWTMAIRSVGPIAWAWAKKSFAKPFVAVAGWAIAKGLVGHDSWLAAVVELWRRIRS
jgi:hypothetical protein